MDKEMEKLIKSWNDYSGHHHVPAAEELIDALQARINEMESPWIPVSERLPPDCSRYAERSMHLISNAGFVTIGYWHPELEWWSDGDYDITKQVTHWMPLPKPPEAK